jgi:hypothetical protein
LGLDFEYSDVCYRAEGFVLQSSCRP